MRHLDGRLGWALGVAVALVCAVGSASGGREDVKVQPAGNSHVAEAVRLVVPGEPRPGVQIELTLPPECWNVSGGESHVSVGQSGFAMGQRAQSGLSLVIERVLHVDAGLMLGGSVVGGGTFSLAQAPDGTLCGGVWMGRDVIGLEPGSLPGMVQPRVLDAARLVNCHAHALGLPALGDDRVSMGQAVLGARQEGAAFKTQRGTLCADDPGTIDVLIVYTPLALAAAGGFGAIQARALDFAAATGTAAANSQIEDLAVSIAGFEMVAYDEVAPDWLDHLFRVTNPTDGFLDEVHALRDQYRADTVMLVVDDPRFSGGAAWWAIWSEAQAFSVMNWRELGGGHLTASHELGHNLGCAHDRQHDESAPFDFSWGYRYESGGTLYGTIMSVGPDVYIPNYANPNVLGPGGEPTGRGLNHPLPSYTALTIRASKWTLANYRQSLRDLDCNNNGIADSIEIAGGAADENGNGILDECEERVMVDGEAAIEGAGTSWADARRDLHEVLALASLRCNPVFEIWVADGTYLPGAESNDRWLRFSLRRGLSLLGGFQGQSHPTGGETEASQRDPAAYETILSGDIGVPIDAGDNSYAVVDAFDADQTAVLDGFTVRDGAAFGDGAGIYVFESGCTIRNCHITWNAAQSSGAGLAASGPGSVRIEDCLFDLNSAQFVGGAIVLWYGAHAEIINCTIIDNIADYGGAIGVHTASEATLVSCLIQANQAEFGGGGLEIFDASIVQIVDCELMINRTINGAGGALQIGDSASVSIVGSVLSGNEASWVGGAIALYEATLELEDSALEANEAEYGGALALSFAEATLDRVRIEGNLARESGGGIDIFGGSLDATNTLLAGNHAKNIGGGIVISEGAAPAIINCTIARNTAGNLGGGISTHDSNVIIANTVAWENTAGWGTTQEQQIFVFTSPPSVRYSIIEGWSGGGMGNLSANPQFVDANGGDFSLLLSSPAIDAGSNPDLPALFAVLDLAGQPRKVDVASVANTGVGPGPIVDIGAFEHQPVACPGDWNGDGVLDFFDVQGFLGAFSSRDPRADLNNDGLFNFFDVQMFLQAFSAGCP
ncbi:MAG: hypothetical protein KF757_13910 [Phycisphaeraceae bacterium]|nr:hypothetical protein [Phycisphaeraceae bacterium]MCW5764058.1 hypothetical protein [Phycisphaeraceae bacterium]